MTATRGTSNRNDRGSAETRRRRRAWLVETYRANVDLVPIACGYDHSTTPDIPSGFGIARPGALTSIHACRCYRCGVLLTVDTVTVDRIIPGCQGGTYKRTNIRPCCGTCNSETGGALRSKL